MMAILIERARANGVHVMVGGIDASNQGSIRLHEKLGFVHAGTIRQAGFKFGRWLDLAFYQLTLDTPDNPVDGLQRQPRRQHRRRDGATFTSTAPASPVPGRRPSRDTCGPA
jgi:hypothetical protein